MIRLRKQITVLYTVVHSSGRKFESESHWKSSIRAGMNINLKLFYCMNVLSTNVFCTSQTTDMTVFQYLDAETFMEINHGGSSDHA
jgi:hypothetical protein